MRGVSIAMIFQDPMTSLNPVYTVGWQIAEAVRAHQDVSKDEAMAKAVDLLKLVGIPNATERAAQLPARVLRGDAPACGHRRGHGQQPRGHPGRRAHDRTRRHRAGPGARTLRKALEETGASLLLITHDLGVIAGLADRVLVMYAGRPVEIGTVDQLFYRPAMPYTHGLLGSLPRLDAEGGERLRQIPGSPPSLIGDGGGCPFAPRCPLRRISATSRSPRSGRSSTDGPRAQRHGRRTHRRRGRRRPCGRLPLRRRGGDHADGVDVPGLLGRPRRGGAMTS